MTHDPGQRLQKALAHLGLASRREAEQWIRAGRLTVNGQVATLGTRVRESDQLRLDGRLVRRRPAAAQQAFLLHRSPGELLSARPQSESAEHENAMETLAVQDPPVAGAPSEPRTPLLVRLPRLAGRRFVPVSPMPRVDGGLELVSSDGELAGRLQRAVRRLDAEFSVRVRGELDTGQLERIGTGLLDRGEALEVLSCVASGGEGSNRWYALALRGASGKDVRQLVERQGALVSRVLRTRLGPLGLDRSLARGQFRKLTPQELKTLLAAAEPDREVPAEKAPQRVQRTSTARRVHGARRNPTARRSSRR
jgi:23S rRNA pseudouridine2605 synthase